MKSAFSIAIGLIVAAYSVFFWKAHRDKQKEGEAITTVAERSEKRLDDYMMRIEKEREANAVKELHPEKPWGAAATAVRTLFQHWKNGDYQEMREMIADPPHELDEFAGYLKHATVNWRRLEIASEKQDGKDWKVAFHLEVTSPKSALAAFALNEIAEMRGHKGENVSLQIPALILGIEGFVPLNLVWTVTASGNKMLIRAYPGKDEKAINLISYVTSELALKGRGIGFFKYDALGARDPLDRILSTQAFWLTCAKMDLILTEEQSKEIIHGTAPLVKTGQANLNMMGAGAVAKLLPSPQNP